MLVMYLRPCYILYYFLVCTKLVNCQIWWIIELLEPMNLNLNLHGSDIGSKSSNFQQTTASTTCNIIQYQTGEKNMGKMNRDLVMYITTCTVPVVLFAVLGTHTLSGEKQLPKAGTRILPGIQY